MAKSFLFILNPASGGKDERKQIIKKLEEGLPDVELAVFKTSGRDDLSTIQKEAGRKDWDAILVGGGDGTINLEAPVIIERQLPLGIISLGSANGLAACLGIPEVDEAMEAIRSGNLETIDAIKMNGQRCLHMSNFGFNAGLIKRFERSNERGMMSYFKSSLGEFLEMKPYHFVIENGNDSEEIEAKIVVMANGDRYGTGAIINPWGRMNDGEVMKDTGMVEIVCEPGPLRVFAPERK